jgi:glycosyltransferase involved in cell wall biosynthesis/GT2 family glycosyltransferase
VEDLHASYWEEFEGGLHDPGSAMAFLKRLADIIHHEHWQNRRTLRRRDLLAAYETQFGIQFEELELARIHSIEFVNSLCIIRKLSPDQNVLGHRVVAGTEEYVTRGDKKLDRTAIRDSAAGFKDDSDLEIFDLMARVQVIETQLAEVTAGRDRVAQELAQVKAERDQLSGKVVELQTALKTEQEASAAKNEQLAQVKAERDQLSGKVVELQTALKIEQEASAAKNEQLVQITADGDRLAEETNEVKAALRAQEDTISAKDREIYELAHSESYRFGLFCTWPFRKVWNVIRNVGGVRSLSLIALPPVSTEPKQHGKLRHEALDAQPGITQEFQGTVDAYQAWVDVNIWNYRREEHLRSRLRELDMPPLLSVVMPIYNPPVEWLNRAIETVRCQVYTNWELCIADDASTDGEVRTALIKWAENDDRIKICYRERNGNISAATNSAASLAGGSHLVFLDQDDELTPDALGEIALYIVAYPEADVLYSDDDKIDVDGKRFAPQFKPDWSPELLLSYMYFSHVFVVSRKLFEEVGGTKIGFEGSQDYDLALRVSEKARHVGHIPLVLYHWRVLPGSTASSGKAKPDSMEAGKRAVHEALQRRAMNAAAYQPDWALQLGVGIFSHRFSLPGQPRVTIIIPTKDQVDVLKRCVSSILEKTDYHNYEILIIDNESAEQKTTRYLNKISKNNNVRTVRISNPESRFNFAYINNRAVRSTSSEYVLFLNNDTEVLKKDWLTQMVGYARIPGVGAVGARLFYPDKRIQHAGVLIKFYHGLAGHAFKGISKQDPGYLGYAKALRNYSAVTAACLLTSRKLFLETGGFDDRNFSVAYNDVDYCGRLLEKGYRVVYTPEAELVHHEGFSRGFCDEPRENVNFKEKYYRKKDRYYSRSLSLDNEYFEVWPRAVFSGEFGKTVRVLMCAHNLNHEGAPYSQYEMTVDLKKKGVIDPVVFSPTDGPLRALYESQRIKVIVDESLGAVFDPTAYHERVKAFAAFITGLGVEMVYANTVINFHAIASARKAGLPSLWNIRESEQWQHYENWWGAEIAGEAAKCFAYPYKVIFVAHTTKHVYRLFEWRHNFHVIYNGLNLERIYGEAERYDRKAMRKELGISDDELAVLLPGTICERKGQHDLVRALALLGPECLGKIRCFIVGETESPLPYSKELHAIADSLPAAVKERLSILPVTSEIPKFYKAVDIFVCTSKIESFPRIILEAMAFDLPIVTTPVFGIQEQVQQGVNALFYPPGDHGALAKALESLITDEGMRRRFSENSKYVFRQLQTFDEMVAEYETLFREAYLSLGPRARMPECIDIYRAKNSPRQSPIRKVSFLTSYKDENSQRFRVYNLVEELTRHGVECAVIKEDCAGSLDRVLDSDVLVAFRVASSPNVHRILDACGRAGVATVFDVDDLVFEPESADLLHGLSALGKADRIKAVERLQRLRQTLLACDYATCTTKALAGRIEHLGKRCFVIPNTINRRQLELAREIRKSGKRADDSRIRIGYFSGTKTHERDFMEASDALYELMEKNRRVDFHLVGILDLDPKFSAFGKRIIRQPLMDYLEMLRYLAGMDINLAPLEMNNIFTACKSELKIFESALFGIPTMASATESYAGCITDDVNGFLAGSKDEWVKKLEMITRDAALRRRIAGQAEQDFVKKYSIENVITDVVGTYVQIASNRRITNE